jgi:hypothetical protein
MLFRLKACHFCYPCHFDITVLCELKLAVLIFQEYPSLVKKGGRHEGKQEVTDWHFTYLAFILDGNSCQIINV